MHADKKHSDHPKTIGLLWRGNPGAPVEPQQARQWPIFQALQARGIAAEAVIFAEAEAASIEARLDKMDGVLVWVDPISDAGNRSALDRMLRRVAAQGVVVSAHPDTIARMGVKSVLHATRELGWGCDTERYDSAEDLMARFPAVLARGPRVLKPNRGNGGIGVVRISHSEGEGLSARVDVTAVRDDELQRGVRLQEVLEEAAAVIGPGEPLIDQAFQPGVSTGMVRCYVSETRVVGFAEQWPRRAEHGESIAIASPKTMYPPEEPRFAALRARMEDAWIAGMQRLLDLEEDMLPALWDADFLPRADGYVLCEINTSSVAPFPPSAADAVAETMAKRIGWMQSTEAQS